jgi:hypothetical protein
MGKKANIEKAAVMNFFIGDFLTKTQNWILGLLEVGKFKVN